MDGVTKTTCPYCGVGCGLELSAADGVIGVRGDPGHPANRGRICSKGAALGETVGLEGRLLQPRVGSQACDWNTALDTVAAGFRRVIDTHGPDAVAFYVSGQLLTEDYYVANKLMKGFIGSGNIDTNSRLCMSSSVAGHKRAFGSDSVPCCYEDLELADLIVLVGSNTAWCHPVLFQRIRDAKQTRPELKVVVVDPRRTPTCDIADLHLALRPGSDIALFSGLLSFLERSDRIDWPFVVNHTEGLSDTLTELCRSDDPVGDTARACHLPAAEVLRFFQWFSAIERTVSVYSQGVNQWSCGSDKVNAIINCHLATGRIGRPGMGPFSFTGQPNAMGGREVGGLANQLAAHLDIEPENLQRVAQFWDAPSMFSGPGLNAVEMFEAVAEGRIKAIWIMATNPVVSMPDADRVRGALETCELVVVSDMTANTDTAERAHVLLPATTWGEKEGTVTNSERRISRQRAFLPTPGMARPDWWIICQVARRMGFQGFDYKRPAAIFREHARLSGLDNRGCRDFDISALSELDDDAYEALAPIQWPVNQQARDGTPRLFGSRRFFTPSGRARFVPTPTALPGQSTSTRYPLILNTGRVRDHWHTMTRTGKSPRLSGHTAEPFVQVHPGDAVALGLQEGELAALRSHWGRALLRVKITDSQQAGSVFAPMHWNGQYAAQARVGALVNPCTDALSGQPEFKHTPVAMRPYRPRWHAFAMSRRPLEPLETNYWTRALRDGMWHYELAGETVAADWSDFGQALLRREATAQWSEMRDTAQNRYRAACFSNDKLEALVFVGPDHRLPARDWLARLFAKDFLEPEERARLLAGAPAPGNRDDAGCVVCSCHGVGRNTLQRAIREQNLDTVELLGEALGAGTNCGSCIPELRTFIQEAGEREMT